MGEYLREEIQQQFDIDWHIGVADDQLDRCYDLGWASKWLQLKECRLPDDERCSIIGSPIRKYLMPLANQMVAIQKA